MHFSFVDSSVDNVLLQISPIRFEFIDISKQRPINLLLQNIANNIEWTVIKAVRGYISGMMKFTYVFSLF